MAGAGHRLLLLFIPPFVIFLLPVKQRSLKDNCLGHVLLDVIDPHAGRFLGQGVGQLVPIRADRDFVRSEWMNDAPCSAACAALVKPIDRRREQDEPLSARAVRSRGQITQ